MRKLITLIIILLANILIFAQDTIKLSSGVIIYGLITNVTNDGISFKIDGGFVPIEQVLSYHKLGDNQVTLPATITPVFTSNAPTTPPVKDCEKNNTGDVVFTYDLNKHTGYYSNININIYAIGIKPNGNSNPLITTATCPPNGSVTVFDLTTGVHYFKASNCYEGQVSITKCGTAKFTIMQ